MKVKIVADSTADIPPEVAAELDITVVPAEIRFADEVYRNGVDLTTDEFYQKLQSSPILPRTSAPSIGTFREVYGRLSQQADSILSIHVAANLSVTHDVARAASADLECPVSIVDSQTASMACGLLAIVAAKAALAGASLAEIEALVLEAVPCTITFGVFGTLEYLAKGGRIGKAQAFLGSLLKIHPILAIRKGEVLPIDRVRTRSRAVERLCEIVQELCPAREMAIMHATNPQDAESVAQRLSSVFPLERMYRASIGPTMGTQVGPNAVGVALISEREV